MRQYFFLSLKKDNRASLTMTLAQNEYCRQKALDPEDPRCAHVILTGRIVKALSTPVKKRSLCKSFTNVLLSLFLGCSQ